MKGFKNFLQQEANSTKQLVRIKKKYENVLFDSVSSAPKELGRPLNYVPYGFAAYFSLGKYKICFERDSSFHPFKFEMVVDTTTSTYVDKRGVIS